MTTPEQPDEGQDSATGAGRGHSAPRPVPPLTPPATTSGASSTPGTDAGQDPDATSVALPRSTGQDSDPDGAPTRVSAFPAFGRSRTTEPRTTEPRVSDTPGGESDDDVDRTTTTPVVAPGPSTDATTRIPTSSGSAGSAGSDTATPRTSASVERDESDLESTRAVPLADPDALAGSTNGRLRANTREPLPDEDWASEPTKRGASHVWGVLGVLVAAPVTWFLLTDGALRTFYGLPPESPLNAAGLLSLAGGIIGLVIIAVVTRVTSLGAWIWGGVITLAGLAGLVVPVAVDDFLSGARDGFLALHEGFGTNLHDYLTDTSRSGLLLVFGLVLLLLAFVSHGARRSGRYEGRVRAERDARGL